MLLSIIVYTLVGIMLCCLGWHYNKRVNEGVIIVNDTKSFFSWEILASIALFTLVAGFRYKTGWDWTAYQYHYLSCLGECDSYRGDYEYGFVLLSEMIALTKAHYVVYFSFWALLQIGCLYYAIVKKPFLLPWIGLCIMLGPFFLHWMNSIRQGIVECMFVSMAVLIEKRKFLPYVIFTILAMTIHKSAILLLPFYGLVMIPYKIKNKYVPFIIYGACFLAGLFPILISWTINAFGDVLDFFGYGKYVSLFNTNSSYTFKATPFGPVSCILMTLHLFVLYYYPKVKAYFKDDKFLNVSFRFTFMYMCYFVLVNNTAIYFKRPCELLLPFFLVMIAYVLSYLFKAKRWIPFLAFAMLSFSTIFVTMAKDYIMYHTVETPSFYHLISF